MTDITTTAVAYKNHFVPPVVSYASLSVLEKGCHKCLKFHLHRQWLELSGWQRITTEPSTGDGACHCADRVRIETA